MIFVDFERDAIPSSGMKKVHRSEFLAKLTSDPKLLTDAIEAAAANARAGFYDTRKWGSAKDKVCVAVFPRGTLTLDLNGTQTTPVSFTPGTVMGLAPLKEQFGDPGEIEDWAGGLGERLRIERFVYWWDEVGVAASPDGSITHVFLRLESKLKHR